MIRGKKYPEFYLSRNGVMYVYDSRIVETYHGPEREIKLAAEKNWRTGPHIELSECMGREPLADMAIDQLLAE